MCQSVQSKITPDVLEKDDRSPVTVADFASQAVICRAIGAAFPGDPIIGEEESSTLSRGENAPFLDRILAELRGVGIETCGKEACAWIDRASSKRIRLAVLDSRPDRWHERLSSQRAVCHLAGPDRRGTNPGRPPGLPQLAVRAGQAHGSARSFTRFAAAEAGRSPWKAMAHGGRFMPARNRTRGRPVFASRSNRPIRHRAFRPRWPRFLGITREPLRLDSQAKYAVVARGEAEIYLRLPAKFGYKEKIWDHAGGVLLVEEAGGCVCDVMGQPLEFNHGYELLANRGIVAANRPLHPRVISALHEIYAKFPPPQAPPVVPTA